MGFLGTQLASSWKAAHWLEPSHRRWGLWGLGGALSRLCGSQREGQSHVSGRMEVSELGPQWRSQLRFRDKDAGGVYHRGDIKWAGDDMGPSLRGAPGL